MIKRNVIREPFFVSLIREFLPTDADQLEDLRPIGNKEFYSILAMVVVSVGILAVTIGPIGIR